MTDGARAVECRRVAGPAGALHGRDLAELLPSDPGAVALWRLDLERPAIALGSRQPIETIDAVRCRRLGVDVVRRRSGGGLVHLVPGEVLWIDVVVGADHPARLLDVRQSMVWMGERWRRALATLHIPDLGDTLDVHEGAEQRSAWSQLVCFAGLGPGEVTAAGAKLVGISQRRTRAGARFQCAVLHHYRPAVFVEAFAVPTPDPALLPKVATVEAGRADRICDALMAALSDLA